MPNGTFSISNTGSGTSISDVFIGPSSVSFTLNVTNNNATNQRYIASWGDASGWSGSADGIVRSTTISIPVSSPFLGNEIEGNAVINRIAVSGNNVGTSSISWTTGTPDAPPPPPPPPAPSFTDTTVSGGTLRKSYSDGVTASNTSSYAIASGSLPTGLSLNTSNGYITGTPTVQGSFTFAITATGGGGSTGSGNLTIQILPPGNRRNSSDFSSNLAVAKRYNGTSWVDLTTMKRFNGTAWVDISN